MRRLFGFVRVVLCAERLYQFDGLVGERDQLTHPGLRLPSARYNRECWQRFNVYRIKPLYEPLRFSLAKRLNY